MTRATPRRHLPLALDWVAALLFCAAILIHLTGGFYLLVGDVRVSARRDERALLLAAAVVGIRLLLDRRQGAFGVPGAAWREHARSWFRSTEKPALHAPPGVWRRALLATIALGAVGTVLMHEQLAQMDAVPDYGDPLLSTWRLSWVWHQLRADPRHLFDANIFYPEALTLTYSDSTLLPAITAAPFLAAGVHPVVAYNVVFLSGFLLSGVATYVLVERLTGSAPGAFVSALLFAYYPYRFEHYSHLELQMTQWMPLTLLALHLFLESGRARYAIGAALAWTAQLYSSMYYAVFLAIYAAAVGTLLALVRGRAVRPLIAPLALAGALAAFLSLPLVRAYAAPQALKVVREPGAVRDLSATAGDYFRVHERNALYHNRMPPSQVERALFPGILPLALASTALVPPLSPLSRVYAGALVVAFEGSLGFNGWLYPVLYDWFPPVRRMRVAARFSILVGLSLAVLAGFGARRLLQRFDATLSRQRVVFALIVAAAVLEARPVLRLQAVWREPPAIYAPVAEKSGVVLAEFPVPLNLESYAENTAFMYFSLWHWKPMLNGYSGLIPPSYAQFVHSVGDFPAPPAIEFLRARRVSHVTVNCALFACAPLVDRVEQSPAFRRVATTTWEGYPVHLYELLR